MLSYRLKVFRSVARNLSFTQAAREMFISQPAISKHIRELEQAEGLRLFIRQGNRISLTHAGKILLAYTEQVMNLHERLENELLSLKDQVSQRLRIGASTTLAQYLIPGILSQFRKLYPDHQLSLSNGHTAFVQQAVSEAKVDVGIVEQQSRSKDFCYEPFIDDPILLVQATHNTREFSQPLSVNELPHIPMALRKEGSGTRKAVEKELLQQGITLDDLNIRMFFDSTESLKSFLLSDDCVGFLPWHAVRHELGVGLFREIELADFDAVRRYSFVYRQGPKATGSLRRFINLARKWYNP